MQHIGVIPKTEFDRLANVDLSIHVKLSLLADCCRVNTLSTVKLAGSGHLGSSFSSLDLVTYLYYKVMDYQRIIDCEPDRDIYFSSKGHDVPGQYAVLYSLGIISQDAFLRLRRLGGTPGHPDVSIPGIEANTGSLGMGISKAKGMAAAKKLLNRQGQIYVMIGDGELQEGQNYEALQSAAHLDINNLWVIVDHNKVQSDKRVNEIIDLRDLEKKFRSFGWHVARCDGHNFREIDKAFTDLESVCDKPKILIADTIKGKGVSFMEHPFALNKCNGLYTWHSGAPNEDDFKAAHAELIDSLEQRFHSLHLPFLKLEQIEPFGKPQSKVSDEYIADAFGSTLIELAGVRDDLIVLDADLAADCRIREFEDKYPERFIENGIAEQDMVSTAGGLALQGLLPIVNSFGSFLSSRANEQIFNNASENTKIIYINHFSGLIPAGPGNSHQSLRDISLFGSIPNMEIVQPCNALETALLLDYAVNDAKSNVMIRLNIGPSPQRIGLQNDYLLNFGTGATLNVGTDALLFAYGPVMLNEALVASDIISDKGLSLKVVNMPWLNRINIEWFEALIKSFHNIFILEDHYVVGGLGDFIIKEAVKLGMQDNKSFNIFGVQEFAACGSPQEVLKYHGLDGESVAGQIINKII